MSGSVPLRLPIYPDESLYGYLTRLAERNGYDRFTWMLPEGLQRQFDSGRWPDETVPHLAKITGLADEEIRSRIYRTSNDDTRRFFGNVVERALVEQPSQRPVRKYCVDCLRKDGYHSALFDLSVVRVCPRHGRRLSGRCPHCGRLTCWGFASLTACRGCNGALLHDDQEIISTQDLVGVNAIASLAGFQHRHRQFKADTFEIPAGITHLSLGQLITLIVALPKYLGQRATRSDFLEFNDRDRHQLHQILSAGWQFVAAWPTGFYEFLELYSTERTGTKRDVFGMKNAFGPLYAYLSLHSDNEPWKSAGSAFNHYVQAHWSGHAVLKPRPGETVRPDRLRLPRVTINEAAHLLGRSTEKVRDLIDRGILNATRIGGWKGAPILIRREDIAAIAPGGQQPMTLTKVGKMLGIAHRRQIQFLEAGILTPIHGPIVDGAKVYMFNAGDVTALLDDIERHFPPDQATATERRQMTFSSLLKSLNRRGLPLKQVIDAMRSGAIRPVRRNKTQSGLGALVFDYASVVKTFRALEARLSKDTLTVASTAQHLHINYDGIMRLAERRILSASRDKTTGHLHISRESIEKFESRYVKISELAKRYGASEAIILRAAGTACLKPVAGTKRLHSVPILFEREKAAMTNFRKLLTFARIDSKREKLRANRERWKSRRDRMIWDIRLRQWTPSKPHEVWFVVWRPIPTAEGGSTRYTLKIFDPWSRSTLMMRKADFPTSTISITVLERARRSFGAPEIVFVDRARVLAAAGLTSWAAKNNIELRHALPENAPPRKRSAASRGAIQ